MIYSHLNEYTRKRLLDKSRKDTPDKFRRRTEISNDEISLLRVGIQELMISGDLLITFKVRDYIVYLKILKFKPTLDKYLSGKFKGDKRKAVTRALNHSLRYNHIQVRCSCPDFKYRYSYMATLKGYGMDTDETRPATHTNPNNIGGLCKHISKVLNVPSFWTKKVITAVKGYIRDYSEEES